MENSYTNLKKVHDKNGEIEFDAEIPIAEIEHYIVSVLARAAENFKMPGFRPGKVPHDVVRKEIGEMALLEDAANDAIRDAVREIIELENLVIVGMPQITVTKLAPGNPVGLKVRFAIYPEIKLPDYMKIGKAVNDRKAEMEVTEKDVEDGLDRIKKMFAMGKGADVPPPEINDEFVGKLGPFKTVDEFKAELKTQLAREKELNTMEAKRDETVREIVKESKLKLPELLVEQELEHYLQDQADDLKNANIKLDDYLKEIGKTAEQFAKEQKTLIEDRIRTGLVLRAIREKEELKPEERDVQMNIAQLKMRYPDRSDDALRESAEAIAIQKKLFDLLEGKLVEEK